MKAILEFNLPEENPEFEMAVNASKMYSVLWQMDQWLRAQYKYMPDAEFSEAAYDAYEKSRQQLMNLMSEDGITFSL
jgi:hypothetical protein